MPEKLLSPTSIKPIPLPSLRLPPLLPLLLWFFGILPPATKSFPITSPMIGQSTNPHANMSLVQEMLLERHSNGDPIFDINGQSELEEHRPEHFEVGTEQGEDISSCVSTIYNLFIDFPLADSRFGLAPCG